MTWMRLGSSWNFFASLAQAGHLLSHDHPPPRVPPHRVNWTRGRVPSIPSRQHHQALLYREEDSPQRAPRPPQRRRSMQQVSRLSPPCCPLSGAAKPLLVAFEYISGSCLLSASLLSSNALAPMTRLLDFQYWTLPLHVSIYIQNVRKICKFSIIDFWGPRSTLLYHMEKYFCRTGSQYNEGQCMR